MDIQEIAKELLAVLGTGRQIAPLSKVYPDFGLGEVLTTLRRPSARERTPTEERSIGARSVSPTGPSGRNTASMRRSGAMSTTAPSATSRRRARGFPPGPGGTPHRTRDHVSPGGPARARHGRAGAHPLHRLDRPRLSDRAVDLPELVVSSGRHRRRLRPPREALHRTASFGSIAAREVGARTFALRDRSFP